MLSNFIKVSWIYYKPIWSFLLPFTIILYVPIILLKFNLIEPILWSCLLILIIIFWSFIYLVFVRVREFEIIIISSIAIVLEFSIFIKVHLFEYFDSNSGVKKSNGISFKVLILQKTKPNLIKTIQQVDYFTNWGSNGCIKRWFKRLFGTVQESFIPPA